MLDIDRDRQRISLGLKQTQEDPWQRVVDTYNVGDELEGTVTKVVTFGAFVEILDGVEGLVHISELANHHVENPREVVQPGDDVRVQDPRDRLRAPPPVAVGQARRGPDPAEPRGAPRATGGADLAGDLDDVPDLGLSEDVFAGAAPAPTRRAPRRRRPSRRSTRPRPPSRSRPPSRGRGEPSPRLAAEDAEAPAEEAEPLRLEEAPAEEAEAAEPGRGGAADEPAAEEAPERRGRRGADAEPGDGRRRSAEADAAEAGRRRRTRRAAAGADSWRPSARVPFVGLTGGLGAGKSTALAALERLGAATLSTDAVVHELYAVRRGARRRRRALGRRGRARTASSTAPRSPATRSPIRTSARGSRSCCGRSSASGSCAFREHALDAPTRAPRAAVVETPLLFEAGHGRRLRRDDRGRRRRGRARASAPPPAATTRSTSGPRASCRRRRRRDVRRSSSQTPEPSRLSLRGRSCPPCLTS